MDNNDKNIKLPYFGIPKVLPYTKKYRKKLLGMIILGIIASMFDAMYPLFNRYALDHFIGLKTLDTLGIFLAIYIGVLIIQVIINFLSMYWSGQVEMSVNHDLRNASFNHLQTLSFSYFNQNNVGYIHARVLSDTGKIGELVSWRMMDIVWNGAYIIVVLITMLVINARLALYVIILVPIATLFITYFQKKLVTYHRNIREMNSKITSDFNEGITGARSIKTLVVESLMKSDFDKDTSNMRQTSVRATKYSAFFSATIVMMGAIALSLVLWQGGLLTMERVMMIGTLSVFMNYALNLMEPIQWIIETIAALIGIQVNIERFTKLMNTESDVADSKEVIEKYGDTFNPKKENWEPLEGHVEFKDVSFKYPDGDEMVLEHFNLDVPIGTNIAIVGETGAGKSTLVNLVCRFFEPTSGEVLIDGRNAKER